MDGENLSLEAIEDMILSGTCSFVAVISEPEFRTALRRAQLWLTDFIQSQPVMVEIFDYLLTDEYIEDKGYVLRSLNIIKFLHEFPDFVTEYYAMSEFVIERMKAFANKKWAQGTVNCGFFQQLMELYVSQSQGVFLSNFKKLPILLCYNLHLLSFRVLFTSLASNYPEEFGFSAGVIRFMLNNLNTLDRNQVMICLFKLSKVKALTAFFGDPKVILCFLQIANSSEVTDFVSTLSFQVVDNIITLSADRNVIDDVIQKYAEHVELMTRPINFGTCVAMKIFKKFVPSLVLAFLNNPAHMFLGPGVLASIEAADDDLLVKLIEDNNIVSKLIWAMNVAKSNGHLTKFALFLDSKREISETLQTAEWQRFMDEIVKKREETLREPPEKIRSQDKNRIKDKKDRRRKPVVAKEQEAQSPPKENSPFLSEIFNRVSQEVKNAMQKAPESQSAPEPQVIQKTPVLVAEDSFVSDSDSDSDDDTFVDVFPEKEMHHRSGRTLSVFGPISERVIDDQNDECSSSGSSDDEMYIKVTPDVIRKPRRNSFTYSGKFSTISDPKYGGSMTKPEPKKRPRSRSTLPQLVFNLYE